MNGQSYTACPLCGIAIPEGHGHVCSVRAQCVRVHGQSWLACPHCGAYFPLGGTHDCASSLTAKAPIQLMMPRDFWEDYRARLRRAVNASCTCGGGDLETGCPACQVWHRMEGR
jgi:hypothetical protein